MTNIIHIFFSSIKLKFLLLGEKPTVMTSTHCCYHRSPNRPLHCDDKTVEHLKILLSILPVYLLPGRFYQCIYSSVLISRVSVHSRLLFRAKQRIGRYFDGFLPPPLSTGGAPFLSCRFRLPPARPPQMGSLPPAPAPPPPSMRRRLFSHLAEGSSYAAQSKNRHGQPA
jgi:hypothetical protein